MSLAIFIAISIGLVQLLVFLQTWKKLKIVRNFFNKNRDYAVSDSEEGATLFPYIAEQNSHLYNLIKEINEYTHKNRGTTDFSIIQNKTEQKINVLYEDAISRITFPTYIGLMGTFLGVFFGLWFFNSDLSHSIEGITDNTISKLIEGVLVSMSTSFVGLFLSTISHHQAAEVQKEIGENKNKFYEYIQTELMPTLGVSMVAALNKLHETINLFEPSFNRVIDRFQSTFDTCTQRFGNAFEQNVTIVSEAVRIMGENMDKINRNVDLNEQLIKTMQSEDIQNTLGSFIEASYSYGRIVEKTQDIENLSAQLEQHIVDLVNTQARYNSSLKVPLSVANKLNDILSRITEFENSINALGRDIEKTDMISNTELEALKDIITSIRKKQRLANDMIELSDGKIRRMLKGQAESIEKLGTGYIDNFTAYAERFQNTLKDIEKEMHTRSREILSTLESKFSIDQIQEDFSHLDRLKSIETMLITISSNSYRGDTDKVLETTREEVRQIREILDRAMASTSSPRVEHTQNSGGFLGGIFGRYR